MARVLVSGGAGFLGSLVCERSLDAGHEVWCLDNLSTGSRENVRHLRDHRDFHLLEQDVCSDIAGEFNTIFNLACPASPKQYQKDPFQTVRTCILGAVNVLAVSRRADSRVLQASTSEVYGDPLVHPQPETYWGNVNPIGPRSCYDEGKRCAETLFHDHHRQFGTRIRIARIFNTYGPFMHPDDGRVVSTFIVQALRNEPITVAGDGSQTRSFCYRDDLVDGLLRLMDADGAMVGPVNLGNPSEIPILHLAERIIAMTGSRSRIAHGPLPADDPQRRCPAIGRAQALLGWQASTSLDEGLRATIAYFERCLSGPQALRQAT
ncbi:UDP-glucuronic acid decarboxylase family protein [Ancylobacter sp.]|uniref:UDP-glucuronic acid decarboxylase family protein n=1 Tax=Ancylobacter sp. TaxID=1872567 RepID=UPI003BAD87F3